MWNVPLRRNDNFMGRETILSDLRTALATEHPPVAVIYGPAGSGKTQVVLEYAYRHREQYTSVIWVEGDSQTRFTMSLLNAEDVLGLSAYRREASTSTSAYSVKEWFEENQHWLFVLEDLSDPQLLDQFCPIHGGNGHVVITTQSPDAFPADYRRISCVPRLSFDEQLLFFQRRPRIQDLDGNHELLRLIDGHPMALEFVASFMENSNTDCARYTRRLRECFSEAAALFTHECVESIPLPLRATFAVSFQYVQQTRPISADILRFSANLDCKAILYRLLSIGVDDTVPATHPHANANNERSGGNWQSLEALESLSLIQAACFPEMFRLHATVGLLVNGITDPSTRQSWLHRGVCAIDQVFPYVDASNWVVCNQLIPHVQEIAENPNLARNTHPVAARLFNQAGYYLYVRGFHRDAQRVLEKGLHFCESSFGARDPNLAITLNNLGEAYVATEQYDRALALFNRSLAIRDQALPPGHPDIAESLHNLAALHDALGNYERAESLFQRCLAIWEQSLGPNHSYVETACRNYAVLLRKLGRPAEAARLENRANAIAEGVNSRGHDPANET